MSEQLATVTGAPTEALERLCARSLPLISIPAPPRAHQLQRMGAGKDPDASYGTRRALLSALRSNGLNTLRRRRG